MGCVVTKEEHAVLTALPKELQGWARCSAAGFYVVDGATGQTVDPVGLERYYGRLDLDEARRLSPGGGARLCLLADCRLLEETDAEWLHRAVRDADGAGTCWMHRRFAQRGGTGSQPKGLSYSGTCMKPDGGSGPEPWSGPAATLSDVPAGRPLDRETRSEIATQLVTAAASDPTGAADPAAAPLAGPRSSPPTAELFRSGTTS